jgi:Flp pilus assembly protein TadD
MILRTKPIPALLILLGTAALPTGSAAAQSLSTQELNARASAAARAAPLPTTPGLAPVIPSDPVEALSRYLRVLAASPRDLYALTGAGNSALAIGDANAAVSLFARAEEVAPRDGRIKAGLASGLVQLGQPRTAIKLFGDAVAFGVPEAEIAGDRGLAYDLLGETRRAQADYAQALRWRPDDEVTRRLAVSQAIAGEKGAALGTLDALLRRQDRAAWRVRAFVLALTGDRVGAETAAVAVMPRAQAQALIPFFGRLATLRPGQKAAAVHLGQFPSGMASTEGQRQFANAAPAALPPALIATPAPAVPTGLGSSSASSAYRPAIPPAASVRQPAGSVPRASTDGQARPGFSDAPAPSALPPYRPTITAAAAPVRSDEPQRGDGLIAVPAPRPAAASAALPASPAATGRAAPQPIALAGNIGAAPIALPITSASPVGSASPVIAAAPGTAGAFVPGSSRSGGSMPDTFTATAAPRTASPAAARDAVAAVGDTAATTQDAPSPGPGPIRAFELPPSTPALPPATLPASDEAPAPAPAARPSRATATRIADAAPSSTTATRAPRPTRDKTGGETGAGKADRTAKNGTDAAARSKDREEADTRKPGKAAKDGKGTDKPKDVKAGTREAATGSKTDKAAKATKADKTKTDKSAKNAKADARQADDEDSPKSGTRRAKADEADAPSGERYWVQVASGANRSDLGKAWSKARAKAPKLLGGRTTWTTPWRQSNRLLVGPFKSEEEAQSLVNSLGKAGMSGIQHTTRGRAKVDRLGEE